MDEDDSDGRDGDVESLLTALRRVKWEVSVAMGHGVSSVKHWVKRRWLPVRFLLIGGFSWSLGQTFGWLLGLFVRFARLLISSLMGVVVPSKSSTQLLLAFFVAYAIHSSIQTKLILVIKTKAVRMDSKRRSEIRADGRGEDFATRLGAIGGILVGMIIGWSFGMDGVFVGAGMGWVLGDELDSRLEAKVNETGHAPREEQSYVEKQ